MRAWKKVIGNKKKVRQLSLREDATKPQASSWDTGWENSSTSTSWGWRFGVSGIRRFRTDKQWSPAVQYREPSPTSWDRSWWKIVWEKKNVRLSTIVSLCCTAETGTTPSTINQSINQGHHADTSARSDGGLEVLASLNWLRLTLDTADSKFLQDSLRKHPTAQIGAHTSFYKNNQSSLDDPRQVTAQHISMANRQPPLVSPQSH